MPQGNDVREGGEHAMLLAVSDKSTTDHVQFTVRFTSIWLHGKENFKSKLLLWFHTLSPYTSYVAQLTCASCSGGSGGGSSHVPSMHTSLSCRVQTVQHSAVCLQCCKRRWTLSVIKIPPLPSHRHHRSCGDRLEGKGENYQVCFVQYCVQQLCTVQCTHIWTD